MKKYTIIPPQEYNDKWIVRERLYVGDTECVINTIELKIPKVYIFDSKKEAEDFILIEKLSS